MKRTASLLAIVIVAMSGILAAQQKQEINKIPPYFYDQVDSRSFVNSQTDTLGGGTLISSAPRKIGGAKLASIVISVTDTCAADIYVEKRLRGTSAWSAVLTDSLIVEATTGKQEYMLRDSDTDNLDCIDCETRIRIAHRASGNGVAGTRTREVQYIYKP